MRREVDGRAGTFPRREPLRSAFGGFWVRDRVPPLPGAGSARRGVSSAWAPVLVLCASLSPLAGCRCNSDKPGTTEQSLAVPPPVPVEVPPPPPPPEPEPVVAPPSPEPAPSASVRKAALPAPAVPACESPCAGTETPDLVGALRARAGQARSCYERALSQNANLQGKMSVLVRVGAQGQPCEVSVAEDTLADASVTRCVVQRFRSGAYPVPQNGCVETNVPINFVPRK